MENPEQDQEMLLEGPPQPGTVGQLVELVHRLTTRERNSEDESPDSFTGMLMEIYPLTETQELKVYFFPDDAANKKTPREASVAEICITNDHQSDRQVTRRFVIRYGGGVSKYEQRQSLADPADPNSRLDSNSDEEIEIQTNEREIRGLIKLLESISKDKKN